MFRPTLTNLAFEFFRKRLILLRYTNSQSVFFVSCRWCHIFCQGKRSRSRFRLSAGTGEKTVPLEKNELYNWLAEEPSLCNIRGGISYACTSYRGEWKCGVPDARCDPLLWRKQLQLKKRIYFMSRSLSESKTLISGVKSFLLLCIRPCRLLSPACLSAQFAYAGKPKVIFFPTIANSN